MMVQKFLRKWGVFIALVIVLVIGMSIALCSGKADSGNEYIVPSSGIYSHPGTEYQPWEAIQQTVSGNEYFVAPNGEDSNPGTENQPWKTIQKALDMAVAGDIVYVREGEYISDYGGWVFQNSGTFSLPITLTNYPNEQVTFRISGTDGGNMAFRCETTIWVTPKADSIKIIGTDIAARTLSNGITSTKGIVIQGPNLEIDDTYTVAPGIRGIGCDYWEVAGIDFVDVGYGIFQQKRVNQPVEYEAQSADGWHVHDNRVHGFYGESGMQFNGDFNTIERNEYYKVHDQSYTEYGCQHINIVGHHNVVRGNLIDKAGSSGWCSGILFEWDLSDFGIYEQNIIMNADSPFYIYGGDNNIIRNNIIFTDSSPQWTGGIRLSSGAAGHCNTEEATIKPPEDPDHPDYEYYYEPRNCESWGNQIYNNTIDGYVESIRFYPDVPQATIIRNNALSGWSRGSICYYEPITGICQTLPDHLIADHNMDRGEFGFVDVENHNYHLESNSSLIDAGYNLGELVSNDFNGNTRNQGNGYDIGAFEFSGVNPTPTFADVPFDHWAYKYIEVLYQEGYVTGCNMDPLMYCPEGSMTRAESAVFVERGLHGGGYIPNDPNSVIFYDVPLTEWFAKWIAALWDDGYTAGCGTEPLVYCPTQAHTRAEGTVFFLRMLNGSDYMTPEPEGIFADSPLDKWYTGWVEAAYNAGLIPACVTEPELRICPEDPLTRDMGAYMMVQAKGLQVP